MSVTEYILVGSEYVPYIKRHKSDKVYWETTLPHERITEEDVKNTIRESAQIKYRIWYGCGRAELVNNKTYGSSWGYDYLKYRPCDRKPYDNTGFCKAHIKSAREDGYIPATYGSMERA
tara:strand:- start:230 stop:586 length:357 start_codon:yes stop_codon:yes gene_type:complete